VAFSRCGGRVSDLVACGSRCRARPDRLVGSGELAELLDVEGLGKPARRSCCAPRSRGRLRERPIRTTVRAARMRVWAASRPELTELRPLGPRERTTGDILPRACVARRTSWSFTNRSAAATTDDPAHPVADLVGPRSARTLMASPEQGKRLCASPWPFQCAGSVRSKRRRRRRNRDHVLLLVGDEHGVWGGVCGLVVVWPTACRRG
jgi:hypothetical protein